MILSLIFSYFYSLVCTSLVGDLIRAFWKNANLLRLKRYDTQTSLLGRIDVTIYFIIFSLFLNGQIEGNETLLAIGGLIALKTVSTVWKYKNEQEYGQVDSRNKNQGNPGERYNIYSIGTLLNLLIGFTGGFLGKILIPFFNSGLSLQAIPPEAFLIMLGLPLGISLSIRDVNKDSDDSPLKEG